MLLLLLQLSDKAGTCQWHHRDLRRNYEGALYQLKQQSLNLLLGRSAWILHGDLKDLVGGRGDQSLAATQNSTKSLTVTQGSANLWPPNIEGLRGFAMEKELGETGLPCQERVDQWTQQHLEFGQGPGGRWVIGRFFLLVSVIAHGSSSRWSPLPLIIFGDSLSYHSQKLVLYQGKPLH